MSLIELLVALGLGVSLSAVIMQFFVGSMRVQSGHSALQDLQQRTAYVQFLLRSAIHGSASACVASDGTAMGATGPHLEVLAAHEAAVSAVPGSHVLRVRTADCEVPVHVYYVGRRGDDGNNLAGLFRRRQRSDGSYIATEELVEGVTAMTASAGITVPPVTPGSISDIHVAYLDVDQFTDWSRVFSVNLTLSVQHVTAISTDYRASGEPAVKGVTMTFSTALRQMELHRGSGGHDGV